MVEEKTKKKRDTSKKRVSILTAATQVFIAEGYDNAGMDRIAEAAGASKRTVYNHFQSKDELFAEVLNQFMNEAFALKQIAYAPQAPLADQLGKFADAKMAVAENPTWLGLMKVTTGVFLRNPQWAREIMAKVVEKEDSLVAWLNAAVADGRLSVADPVLAANAFWAMIGGAFFWPAVFNTPMDENEAVPMKEALIDMFLTKYRRS